MKRSQADQLPDLFSVAISVSESESETIQDELQQDAAARHVHGSCAALTSWDNSAKSSLDTQGPAGNIGQNTSHAGGSIS